MGYVIKIILKRERSSDQFHKVGKTCKYLYRAVDKSEQMIEFMLSAKRDVSAAKRFFKKMLRAEQRRLRSGGRVMRGVRCLTVLRVG
jgi:transposase-like protein